MAMTHEDFSRHHQVKVSSNRTFGLVFVTVLLVIGIWPVVSGTAPRWWSLIASALLLLVTLATPDLLALPNRAWLRIGMLLHRIVSPVTLAVMFFLVVTPMGLIMRVLGKDILRLNPDASAKSYWITRDPPGPRPESMPDQF